MKKDKGTGSAPRRAHSLSLCLSEHDLERLMRLRESEFEEVVSYMLENDCKLEQEAIGKRGVWEG